MLDDADLSMRMKKFGKEKFEPKLYAVTSIRRSKQKGHFKTVKEYLQAYLNLLLKGHIPRRDYLREIKKD